MLRITHLMGSLTYIVTFVCLAIGMSAWIWVIPLLAVVLIKGFLFRRYLAALPLSLIEVLAFMVFIPLQDVCYTIGVGQGVLHCLIGSRDCPIR
jgi:hypothetical protein